MATSCVNARELKYFNGWFGVGDEVKSENTTDLGPGSGEHCSSSLAGERGQQVLLDS